MRIVTHYATASVIAFMGLTGGGAPLVRGSVLPRPTLPAAGDTVSAVWKMHHVEFFYAGRTARYSCDGLRDKVRALLLDLGAKRDVKVGVTGCENTHEYLKAAGPGSSVSVTFAAPALIDTSGKAVHEGEVAAVDTRFERFTVTRDAFRNLGIGDCELVDALMRQVLPKLVTRDVKKDITCLPNQQSASHFLVKGEILRPLPPVDHPPGQ